MSMASHSPVTAFSYRLKSSKIIKDPVEDSFESLELPEPSGNKIKLFGEEINTINRDRLFPKILLRNI